MSLIDEATAQPPKKGPTSVLDQLIAHHDLTDEDRDEITELLKAPVVAHAAAARVIMRHYADKVERRVTQSMVQHWRSVHL